MPGMEFAWRAATMSDEELDDRVNRSIIWLHGVKDFSALKYARKKLI
jgi:hypothetical protein